MPPACFLLFSASVRLWPPLPFFVSPLCAVLSYLFHFPSFFLPLYGSVHFRLAILSLFFSVSLSLHLSRCMSVSVWLCLCPSEFLVLLSSSVSPTTLAHPHSHPDTCCLHSDLPSGVLARVTPRGLQRRASGPWEEHTWRPGAALGGGGDCQGLATELHLGDGGQGTHWSHMCNPGVHGGRACRATEAGLPSLGDVFESRSLRCWSWRLKVCVWEEGSWGRGRRWDGDPWGVGAWAGRGCSWQCTLFYKVWKPDNPRHPHTITMFNTQ